MAIPLLCLGALGTQPMLAAHDAYNDGDLLSALIGRDVAVEDLRLQMAFEQSFTSALVSVQTRPVPGLDEKSMEQVLGFPLASSLATARGRVDNALVSAHLTDMTRPIAEQVNAAKAMADLAELRRKVDARQTTADEVGQYFERADDAVEQLGRSLVGQIRSSATTATTDSLGAGLDAWDAYLAAMHFSVAETTQLFNFLDPDARWQTPTTSYEFAAALSGFDRSLGVLDTSLPVDLRAQWSELRQSPALTTLQAREADLLTMTELGRPVDIASIDAPARANLVRQTRAVVGSLDAFRPILSAFMLERVDAARAQARRDMLFGAGLVAVTLGASALMLLSTNRAIAVPLRRLENALAKLRTGTSDLPTVELHGPAEVAAAGSAFRDLVADVALVEAQAAAIGAGDLLNPVLAQKSEMPIAQSLQQSVRTLSSLAAQLKSREETTKAVLETAADAIWTIDGDAHICSANRATEDLLGWRSSEVVGAHFGSLLASEDDMVVFELLRQQGSVRSEVQLRRANGTTIPALVSAAVTYFEGELMVTVVARDITERKELEGDWLTKRPTTRSPVSRTEVPRFPTSSKHWCRRIWAIRILRSFSSISIGSSWSTTRTVTEAAMPCWQKWPSACADSAPGQ